MKTTLSKGYIAQADAQQLQLTSGDRIVLALTLAGDEVATDDDKSTVCVTFKSKPDASGTQQLLRGGTIDARRWRSFFFNGHDREWEADEPITVCARSCNTVVGKLNAIWYTNVPPRVVAFELADDSWMAMSIPGALPVAETEISFGPDGLSVGVRGYRPTCEGAGPLQIYFTPGLKTAEEALDVHARLTRKLGYFRDRADHPAWWAWPRWGVYDEVAYIGHADFAPPDARTSPLTNKHISEWSDRVAATTGVRSFCIAYDQGYFKRYGEYEPTDSLGGINGFRAVIDQQRERGRRTGLYMHQYFVDRRIPEIAAHPEWLVQGTAADGVRISADMQTAHVDWTHPGARDYMRRVIRRIVSHEEGCLNADWLMINNNHVPDPTKGRFHNPDWAIGDRMAWRVMNEIRDAAKQFKPDCCVSFIGVDPFIQQAPDMVWVNESWGETCDNWYQMARVVTRCLRGVLVAVNPYILSQSKFAEYITIMPAFGMPAAMPLSKIHTHGHSRAWQDFTPENQQRWAAAWQVYANAPMTADQEAHVSFDGEKLEAWRKYTRGPLAGFFAARALRRRALVTYGPTEARIMAFDWGMFDVQLPPGAQVTSVVAVKHAGGTTDWPWKLLRKNASDSVRLEVEDSGAGQTGRPEYLYYRIAYRL